MEFKQYVSPATLEEAWQLNQKKSSRIVAGNLWLRMRRRPFDTAIDLKKLNLDQIEETENCFRVGAMVPLHRLETHGDLNALTGGVFSSALRHIVGVQFRNCATVGGSVFARFGFSDVLTLLMALDANAVLYRGGVIPLTEFAAMEKTRDILTAVEISKQPRSVSFRSVRKGQNSFAVLNCAVSERNGSLRAAIGARPARAALTEQAAGETDEAFIVRTQREMIFETNVLGSAEYRRHLCGALLRRAIDEIRGKGGAAE